MLLQNFVNKDTNTDMLNAFDVAEWNFSFP